MNIQNAKTSGWAVVTGASSGIGLELARQFALHGYDLLIASAGPSIFAAAEELKKEGARVEPIRVDLATYEGVEELYAKIRSLGTPLEAIAINAGVGVGGDFVHDTDLNAELNLIALNVNSTVHLAKRVLSDMVLRRRGKVLFTSSIAATMPAPFEAVYAASKAFIQSFAEALREELKDSGVTITALMPAATDTNFFQRAGMAAPRGGVGERGNPAEVAADGIRALMAGKDRVLAGFAKGKPRANVGSATH